MNLLDTYNRLLAADESFRRSKQWIRFQPPAAPGIVLTDVVLDGQPGADVVFMPAVDKQEAARGAGLNVTWYPAEVAPTKAMPGPELAAVWTDEVDFGTWSGIQRSLAPAFMSSLPVRQLRPPPSVDVHACRCYFDD